MITENHELLRQFAIEKGVDAFGVAETSKLYKYIDPELHDSVKKLPFTISIGIRLQKAVLESLVDRPNQIYKTHYRQVNAALDDITHQIARLIQHKGYDVIPVAASFIIDFKKQNSHLSHRHAAVEAGIGFMGKNNLLIHPDFGAGIRLASLFTDMPLTLDSPIENDCDDCMACMMACPADAITENGYDFDKCYTQIKQFAHEKNYNLLICGLCVKACADVRRKT